MQISFREADWEALEQLWREFFPSRYRVDASLLKQNTIDSPVFDWGASAIGVMDAETLGFVVVKRSANPVLWHGVNQDTFHVSAIAYRDPEVGVDLMSQAKRAIVNRGGNRLVFGMDSRHFFPGCPDDCKVLCSFLMVEGFEKTGDYFDLERDLQDYEMPVEPTSGVRFREVTEADVAGLSAFMDREFPGRWRYDVLEKVKTEGAANTCFGAFDGGRMIGFALIQDWRHKLPIGGAVWRADLGDKWGSLGPIGVAREERGRGIGHSLLGSALVNLKNRAVRRCIIDWTTLGDFYGVHGFEITRRYQSAVLHLD